MKTSSNPAAERARLREKIIGLGEHSFRKSYYPELQNRLADLERIERELRVSEARFKNLFEQSPLSMQLFSPDGGMLDVNKAFEKLWGLRLDALKKYNILHDAQLEARGIMPLIRKAFEGTASDIPVILYDPAEAGLPGIARSVKSFIYPVKDETGKIIQVVLMHMDVTELMRAEGLARETLLRQKAILDSIPDTAWLKDREGRYIAVNQAYGKMVHMPPSEVVGRTDAALWPAEVARQFEENDRAVMRLARQQINEDHFDGRWFETIKTPIFDEKGAVAGTTGISREITRRKEMEETIRHQAYHDLLTGLPNKMLFVDHLKTELAQAQRSRSKFAVLFMDVDHFKNINDLLGHAIGDKLIKDLATRMKSCVRRYDTVCRIGGDEFTLLLPQIESPGLAARIAGKIMRVCETPFTIEGHELRITVSTGISIFPEDGTTAEALLKNADIAMYYAKEQGRNNYQFSTPSLNAKTMERIAIENRLRQALSREELVVHYQPFVNIRTMQITGIEALVRWNHPELGLLYPAHFIPIAEEAGLTIPIDQWVLRTACAQLKKWQASGRPGLHVTVNLSARQFQQPDLAGKVTGILEETGIGPGTLGLEITETIAMQDTALTARNLRQLSGMGIRFLIDDFGTGYSSLSYLKKLPINKLKIDKSFIRDLEQDTDYREITNAIIAMAHVLKLQVVAEGVETRKQAGYLRSRACDEVQGFCFSKPVPAGEMDALLAVRRQRYAVGTARGRREDI